MQRVGFFIIVVVLTLGLIGGGGYLIRHQQTMLSQAKSVPGKILSLEQTGRGQVAVEYEYRYNLTTHISHQLTPLSDWMGMLEVKSVLEQFKVDQSATVYVSAFDATSAYLLPRGYAYPYLLVLLGLGVGIGAWRIAGKLEMFDPSPFCDQTLRTGWHVLPRTATPIEAVASRAIEAALWIITSLFLLIHYFVVVPGPTDATIVLVGVGLLLGIWPTMLAWQWMGIASGMTQTTLSTTLPQIHLDQPVIVRLALPVTRPMTVHEVRVMLICRQRTATSTHPLFTCSQIAATDQTITPDQPWHSEFHFEIPHKKRRVSSAFSRLHPPRITWHFELHVQLDTGRSYTMRFPIEACLPHADEKTVEATAAA